MCASDSGAALGYSCTCTEFWEGVNCTDGENYILLIDTHSHIPHCLTSRELNKGDKLCSFSDIDECAKEVFNATCPNCTNQMGGGAMCDCEPGTEYSLQNDVGCIGIES